MRWSLAILSSVLSISGALAYPAPEVANSTLHSFFKRSVVCGQNVRTAVAQDCRDHHPSLNFVLGGTRAQPNVSPVTLPAGNTAIPEGAACDHIMEIQVLAKALVSAQVCQIITAMTKLDPPLARSTQMQELANIINGPTNLFFLATAVNSRKSPFVQNAIAGVSITKVPANNFAVQSYLSNAHVHAQSLAIAQALDHEVAGLVATATAKANTFPVIAHGRAVGAQIAEQALKTAVANHAAHNNPTPVTTLWQRVLNARVIN
ncbi:hypothetical protein SISSUDRAFT_1032104 [Sistotremastrum suecicum HHB10207 ss-3]|uniref:Uncharacterized protein n=1 Tax=Sistotremastrum suecicum HHB10207 ss-3 TaxID=1314776 RepID=A0A166F003_9AGAM|nr:hypothetical protein SISSUDRAFT_1032104 [Sistotremastrum suecicum HHB10207 ss-3]